MIGSSAGTVQRQDARRNRESVTAAARALLSRDGTEVSVADIAARAGVGKGTVFRHYASKEALIAEIVGEVLEGLLARGRQIAGTESPAEALRQFLTEAVALQADNRAFCEVVAGASRDDARTRHLIDRLNRLVDDLTKGAVGCGAVRPDLTGRDVSLLLSGIYQTAAPLAASEPALWQRYLVLILDGLLPREATPLPHPPAGEPPLPK